MPDRVEIRAVQRALSTNHKKLEDQLSSLDVLLNLAGSSSEDGPPAVGTHDNRVAVEFMGRIADDIRKIGAAVDDVNFDSDDKQEFRLIFKEMAKAWDLRAKALGSSDVARSGALLERVWKIEEGTGKARQRLHLYFGEVDEE